MQMMRCTRSKKNQVKRSQRERHQQKMILYKFSVKAT